MILLSSISTSKQSTKRNDLWVFFVGHGFTPPSRIESAIAEPADYRPENLLTTDKKTYCLDVGPSRIAEIFISDPPEPSTMRRSFNGDSDLVFDEFHLSDLLNKGSGRLSRTTA